MIMSVLFVWYGEDAVEVEKLAWENFRSAESIKDAEFLQVETRAQVEIEHERLTKEGWILQGVGSGSLARISSYAKSEG